MDVSLRSSVIMRWTSTETVASRHITYYTEFKYLRYSEIQKKGFKTVWTLVARVLKLADILERTSRPLLFFGFSLTRASCMRHAGEKTKKKHTEHERVQFLGTTEHERGLTRTPHGENTN